MSIKIHKEKASKNIRLGVLSISSTRSLINDESGQWLVSEIVARGHDAVFHKLILDNIEKIRQEVLQIVKRNIVDVILLLGGTGLTRDDVSIEAVTPLFSKEISAFGIIFSQLSYNSIGSASIMSRAKAGVIGNKAIFCIPGSLNACKLACEKIIFSEIAHVVLHIT